MCTYITAIGHCLGRHDDFPGDGCSWERGHWAGTYFRSLGFYSILPSSCWFSRSHGGHGCHWRVTIDMASLLPWLSSDGRVHFLKGDFPEKTAEFAGTCGWWFLPRPKIAGWILKSSKDPSWPNRCWKSMRSFLKIRIFGTFLLLIFFSGKRCKWTSHHWFRCEPLRTASGLEHLHGRRGRGSRRRGRGGEDVERQGAEDAINGWQLSPKW